VNKILQEIFTGHGKEEEDKRGQLLQDLEMCEDCRRERTPHQPPPPPLIPASSQPPPNIHPAHHPGAATS